MEPSCENLSLPRFASISTSMVPCSLLAGSCERKGQLIKSCCASAGSPIAIIM
jgi:hypothetical protein